MKLTQVLTILLGVFLIAVLAPVTQFLTMMTITSDLEVATPVGWAVGIVFGFALATAVVRRLAGSKRLSRANLVIIYSMLTIAVPVMNMGLVRQAYLSMNAVMNEYLLHGTSTYRLAYNSLDPDWYPVVPTQEGLAYGKADRLLELLQDNQLLRRRGEASRQIKAALMLEDRRLADIEETGDSSIKKPPAEKLAELRDKVSLLGVDQSRDLISLRKEQAAQSLGLHEPLQQRLEEAVAESAAAVDRLGEALKPYDEEILSLYPPILETFDRSSRERITKSFDLLPEERKGRIRQKLQQLDGEINTLLRDVTSLSRSDHTQLHQQLQQRYLQTYEGMPEEEVADIRGSYVYRITRTDRNDMIELSPFSENQQRAPNDNLRGFTVSIWSTQEERNAKQASSQTPEGTYENVKKVWRELPWRLWVGPLIRWGALFTVLFMLMMCLAEWLRRKWIERENLAFPLVEVADQMIRPDVAIETATDATDPEPRKFLINAIFLLGFALGALWLTVEAMGHYEFIGKVHTTTLDLYEKVFKDGSLSELNTVFLNLSPIVIGIAFLVSLEVSFSVWMLFILYQLGFYVFIDHANVVDPQYTGWAGGKRYPFPMEQMLGAMVCLTLILLYKSFRTKSRVSGGGEQGYYLGPKTLVLGSILLIAAVLGLMWSFGVGPGNWWVLALGGAVVLAQTISAARVRAETGLPTHHVSYEFTKMPMVLGITDWMGAKGFVHWVSTSFLPMSLLFRSLPQQLENIELARRHKLRYRTVAASSLLAFVVAIVVGMGSFLLFSYYFGVQGTGMFGDALPSQAGKGQPSFSIARYSLWVSHFLGEQGLDKMNQPHTVRLYFMGIGLGIFAVLSFLRNRFLRFPLHPIGYLLSLMAIHYLWITPYLKGGDVAGKEFSWLWGSVLLAWLVKKLVIKYGGMNTYKRAKPFFVGLVVGSIVTVFAWNVLDLIVSLSGEYQTQPSTFMKHFMDNAPFSPRFY